MTKKALITGITGQDGAYLTEFLLAKGYEVYGVRRRVSVDNASRLRQYLGKDFKHPGLKLVYGDMTDSASVAGLIAKIKPAEIYNLAAQSHVAVSFEQPEYTANCDAVGTLRILEAVKTLGLLKTTRIYQASTSELYGKVREIPQNENTPFHPRSPYGVAKLYGYWITVNYRESYGAFASNGILFNHESALRGETFVTRKVTIALARILLGLDKCLYMGNLNSRRDWGHARDYVEAMWLILQQKEAGDFVIATGKQYSVRQFIEEAAKLMGVAVKWEGKGLKERGVASEISRPHPDSGITPGMVKLKKGDVIVRIDPAFFRPAEVETLLGDPARARKKLGWKPKVHFRELVKEMIFADLTAARKELYLKAGGF
ncbi:MAG: GDP-mannose 4,6-dehydratase [Elusimicrobia bacterium GWA2_56_46]|nr:MAG: GDP-mannose 4,6-dehydratase [Elusimicrobia bacterium GWA2_56_46]OGR53696.1 MAG: GDP-mannose 4,6-dehydratase [Elusimicrobia bacterium GWC2_56_31]HBB66816.1 GDP-mannose 4,6-dehydratase [Elusimicrobiota bacterium]HBW23165.1 GDP-mannose 4,6-dehydratase [Elusimicrobiota bacterium]